MRTRGIVALVSSAVVALGASLGCDPKPAVIEYYPLSHESTALPAERQAEIKSALDETFGTPIAPKVPENSVVKGDRLVTAAADYRRLCLHCHGFSGDGAGPTAAFLQPRPRDYRAGTFKFTTTAPGVKPTHADLLHTLQKGVMYTSMPSFALLAKETLDGLVDYVIFLAMRGEFERMLVAEYSNDPESWDAASARESNLDVVVSRWAETADSVVAPTVKPPPDLEASIARGREKYLDKNLQCLSCHGDTGRGDGPGTDVLKDNWGQKIVPADLTKGIYRGGSTPKDLWLRIYSGVKGTPMPAFKDALTPEQIWDVVNYVRSLARPSAVTAE